MMYEILSRYYPKSKRQKIIILEDQYTPKITKELLLIDKNLDIPIRENIVQPLGYVEDIHKNDIILLDNYFKTKGYEEPYGNDFLLEVLKRFDGKNLNIICISDRGKKLCEWYDGWKRANEMSWIKAWCQNKDGKEIYEAICKYNK